MAAFIQNVVGDTADVGVRATVQRESSAFYGTYRQLRSCRGIALTAILRLMAQRYCRLKSAAIFASRAKDFASPVPILYDQNAKRFPTFLISHF